MLQRRCAGEQGVNGSIPRPLSPDDHDEILYDRFHTPDKQVQREWEKDNENEHVNIHALMRDEKEGKKKQARSNKQQGKATQHTQMYFQSCIVEAVDF